MIKCMKKNNPVRIPGLHVTVRDDNIDRALKKLRKKVDTDGRVKDVRDRQYYIKPSERKRINKKRAIQAAIRNSKTR